MGEKGNDAVAEGTGMRAEDVSAPVGDPPEPEETAIVKSKSNITNN